MPHADRTLLAPGGTGWTHREIPRLEKVRREAFGLRQEALRSDEPQLYRLGLAAVRLSVREESGRLGPLADIQALLAFPERIDNRPRHGSSEGDEALAAGDMSSPFEMKEAAFEVCSRESAAGDAAKKHTCRQFEQLFDEPVAGLSRERKGLAWLWLDQGPQLGGAAKPKLVELAMELVVKGHDRSRGCRLFGTLRRRIWYPPALCATRTWSQPVRSCKERPDGRPFAAGKCVLTYTGRRRGLAMDTGTVFIIRR